jgi:hypothetical protein
LVAAVPSGPKWTPPPTIPNIQLKFFYYVLNLQKLFRNEMLHVQCTTHKLTPF